MEHEPPHSVGGIGHSASSYNELLTFSPTEKYCHDIPGFHHYQHSIADMEINQAGFASLEDNAGLPQAIQLPVGVIGPASTTTSTEILHEQESRSLAVSIGPFAAADMETPHSGNALPQFNMREVNAGLTLTATGEEILPVGNAQREADSLVFNAGLAEPDPYSVDIDIHNATDKEIMDKIHAKTQQCNKNNPPFKMEGNHSLAKMDPRAPVCYVTNLRFGYKTDQGEWKEKNREIVFGDEDEHTGRFGLFSLRRYIGLKITMEFHRSQGTKTTKTNWLMHEYVPLLSSGDHLFFWDQLVIRKVFNKNDKRVPQNSNAENGSRSRRNVNGEATDELNGSKIDNGKRRKRGTDDVKASNEPSKVWQHCVKIYDKFPDTGAGAKVVYAVCRYCHSVLKADNGTRSLLAHCNDSCPCKHLQPTSS